MAEDLATLNILDKEEVPLVLLGDADDVEYLYYLCLVGRVLMDSVVHFSALKNTLEDLWHPLRGLGRGEDPSIVPLWETMFWVQIHNIPSGFMMEGMARQIGDFIGRFLEYDTSLVTRGFGQYMRIRVSIDVRLPLKRKKRISAVQSSSSYEVFQYERLPLFCFLCGRLGHGESFCQFGWDVSLRAAPRKGGQAVSKWLREENETDMWARMDVDGESRERYLERM
ncbi:hypothetical protein GOBAR_AA18253 [Gossypium barbadense]|uniref:Zinc knuckle CX2CX4HX4C domain-containing protein n=1 Tax=Gossypium barbadense TaxID=3634 RepID=A0A2P5XGD5_GOSBA|nr:hypothetical protein GOBAR_AA18253 [Gossypium barbadense]